MPLARNRRSFEVFDVAIVAVVTKALGAFLVLVIILLPYYRSDPRNAPAADAVREHLAQARRAVANAQRTFERSPDNRVEIERRFAEAQQSIDAAERYVQGLRNELDKASLQINRLGEEKEELEKRVKNREDELARLRQQLAEQLRRAEELARENAVLREERDRAQRESARLQAELADALREASRMREQWQTAQRGLDQAQRDNERLQRETEQLRQENERLKEENEGLQRRSRRSFDPSVVMRWFHLGAIIPECADVEFSLYVRWDGKLMHAARSVDMPDAERFDAVDPTRRTVLLGQRYYDLGSRRDDGALSDRMLREAGVTTLGRSLIKTFTAVSSVEGDYNLYIAANSPQALGGRRCSVHPYFLSWAGAVLGDRVVLTQEQPFAWLRRFRIRRDGTNTFGDAPGQDGEFIDALSRFSSEQSQRLCAERGMCGRSDAHLLALKGGRRPGR